MTPSNKNEIMAFWESEYDTLALPSCVITKETEPFGSRPVLAYEFEGLELALDTDYKMDDLCKQYQADWNNRPHLQDMGNYYIYFTDPDDCIWFVNSKGWENV